MNGYDVAVVGAGLAGLACARDLAERGRSVALIDQKPELSDSVHTTGIFVRRTLEDFEFPQGCLGPVIRDVTLYSPRRRPLRLHSDHAEYRIGRMGLLYLRLLALAREAGVEWIPGARVVGVEGTCVAVERGAGRELVRARFVVGADGVASTVARALGLDINREWIVGVEEVFEGVPLRGAPRLHCVLDPELAPGYLAWVAHDGEEVHVGVGGYPQRFQPARALERFHSTIGDIVDLSRARPSERRGGRIPVGGLLARIVSTRGLLLGDASGAVSPLTAGGLDPCLRQSRFAAQVIDSYLRTGDEQALAGYSDRRLRSRFRARRVLRRVFARAPSAGLTEAACAVLRVPGVDRIARHIFFGRGSFPEPAECR